MVEAGGQQSASLSAALRRLNELKSGIEDTEAFRVALVSNAVLVGAPLFAELEVLEAGLVANFAPSASGAICTQLEAVSRNNPTDVVIVIHVDSLSENLAWSAAGRDTSALEEIARVRSDEIASGIDQLPSDVSVHLGVFSGGTCSHGSWPVLRRKLHADIESAVRDMASVRARVHLLDLQTDLDRLGSKACFDVERLTRHSSPLTSAGEQSVGDAIARGLLLAKSPGKKVLALDADNTLWGGVLGELGVSGVQLSPTNYPGNVYYRAQLTYKALKERGALLVLVSKNEPGDVVEMLRTHPNCVLRPEDFVSVRATWEPKAQVIQQLSEELNLDLNTFVFVDDSMWEIASISEQLPKVTVFRSSHKAADYIDTLEGIDREFPVFTGNALQDRTEKYRIQAEARRLERSSRTREEFLQGLQTAITARLDSEADFGRVSEMSQRTNQFNLGLTRMNLDQVASRVERNERLIVFDVHDRFGESGASAALFLELNDSALVSDMWISCRVLGRGIEGAVLGYVGNLVGRTGLNEVVYRFRQGPRNHQVLDFLTAIAQADRHGKGFIDMHIPVGFDIGEGKWVKVNER